MSNTFKEFVTPELLNKMIHNIDRERVILNDNNNYAHIPTLNDIYITLAIYIRIQGLHIMPQENTRNGRPLRDSCMDAKDHFHRLDPSKYIFGIDIVTKLISLELFTAEYTEDLSKKFQEFVLELGNSCVGDEKLFHYTGLTKDIRLVVSKPGRVGLWFYELCAHYVWEGNLCSIPGWLLGRRVYQCRMSSISGQISLNNTLQPALFSSWTHIIWTILLRIIWIFGIFQCQ
jgi:hypothetical protein